MTLSLIMNLFTEPGGRARAMGVYGFVCRWGQHRRAARWRAHQRVELALDLSGQHPCGRGHLPGLPVALLPGGKGQAPTGSGWMWAGAVTISPRR